MKLLKEAENLRRLKMLATLLCAILMLLWVYNFYTTGKEDSQIDEPPTPSLQAAELDPLTPAEELEELKEEAEEEPVLVVESVSMVSPDASPQPDDLNGNILYTKGGEIYYLSCEDCDGYHYHKNEAGPHIHVLKYEDPVTEDGKTHPYPGPIETVPPDAGATIDATAPPPTQETPATPEPPPVSADGCLGDPGVIVAGHYDNFLRYDPEAWLIIDTPNNREKSVLDPSNLDKYIPLINAVPMVYEPRELIPIVAITGNNPLPENSTQSIDYCWNLASGTYYMDIASHTFGPEQGEIPNQNDSAWMVINGSAPIRLKFSEGVFYHGPATPQGTTGQKRPPIEINVQEGTPLHISFYTREDGLHLYEVRPRLITDPPPPSWNKAGPDETPDETPDATRPHPDDPPSDYPSPGDYPGPEG